jgi:glycosyltransferase involved in cell wall biosynthesis
MRILIATDAWEPQVNGVVVTLANTAAWLERWGHQVRILSPQSFRTVPLPGYPEIRLAVMPRPRAARAIIEWAPDAVHIATEGPIGSAVRAHCLRAGLAFTTAYHTAFPDYVHARTGLPRSWTYEWLRRFHEPSAAVMVSTDTLANDLTERGFSRLQPWSRGVDLDLFCPGARRFEEYPRPVFTYVGRVAVEKNLPAFLSLNLPGTKLVVGDGPARRTLERAHPDTIFLGARRGLALAEAYRRSDVFVFPSRTDTFGLVLIEAMASGTPVAAFPVRGPVDVVKSPIAGVLHDDLRQAALAALSLDRAQVRAYAESYSWERCSRQFLSLLTPVQPPRALTGGSALA